LDFTDGGLANNSFSYAFKLNNGEYDYYLNFSINGTVPSTNNNNFTVAVRAGNSSTVSTMSFAFVNKTQWTTTIAPQFKLGASASAADDWEANVTTHNAAQNAGKKTQEIVDDSGLILGSTSSSATSDSIVLKVPSKSLAAKVYFGKQGATSSTGTVKEVVPVITAVGKLDTSITTNDKATKNMVLVGGPCINTLVQALVDAGKLDTTYTCANGNPGSAWTAGTGYIIVVDDPFDVTGKYAVVVAGTVAADTTVAATTLQQYADKLSGITSNWAKVTTSTGVAVAGS